jgi:hypothetical protein
MMWRSDPNHHRYLFYHYYPFADEQFERMKLDEKGWKRSNLDGLSEEC